MDILNKAEAYENKYGQSPEELFAEFEMITKLHADFEHYLKENGLNGKLETMQRCKRSLEKRKLFIDWYFTMNQNKMSSKAALINLSEMTFVSEKTVQKDLGMY